MIDNGVWKTKHTCLIGSKRIDSQYMKEIEARAKRVRDAEKRKPSKQMKLPCVEINRE